MWFDVSAALAALDATPAANPANPANQAAPPVSQISAISSPSPDEPGDLGAVEAAVLGALGEGCDRPGAVAAKAGLGVTATYRAIDRLLATGRVAQARDGTLSKQGGSKL